MTKVLLATDGSAHSVRAAQALRALAGKDPSVHVTVFHVVPLPDIPNPAAAGAYLPAAPAPDTYAEVQASRALTVTVAALGLPPDRVRQYHVIGVPGEAILAEARQGKYDLIVVGRRGLSPLRELFLGSVSQAVLHGASCPVLIVP
ncbi:nucleotide-binding universal stress UspA family protein [Symbiobacterium terraclitae]|uniref:Nucleotide-binding universal stress UspA family protein n=1 Tax=Symbiobacterium terraclitae TaxID=557451 RepID=A0ABS4JRY8_9FIRM|nr:universal stress protein [Symbiobacterium terraclitae]MBP2018298.1 nucleotide-binding universal stress UspA family protein [Symbiobacterium terraclitae]